MYTKVEFILVIETQRVISYFNRRYLLSPINRILAKSILKMKKKQLLYLTNFEYMSQQNNDQ